MSGLTDEVVTEGHDLIDSAEHEAQADPKDFKKVHPVGETGGSILSDKPTAAGGASGSGASKDQASEPGASKGHHGTLESKMEELKERLHLKK